MRTVELSVALGEVPDDCLIPFDDCSSTTNTQQSEIESRGYIQWKRNGVASLIMYTSWLPEPPSQDPGQSRSHDFETDLYSWSEGDEAWNRKCIGWLDFLSICEEQVVEYLWNTYFKEGSPIAGALVELKHVREESHRIADAQFKLLENWERVADSERHPLFLGHAKIGEPEVQNEISKALRDFLWFSTRSRTSERCIRMLLSQDLVSHAAAAEKSIGLGAEVPPKACRPKRETIRRAVVTNFIVQRFASDPAEIRSREKLNSLLSEFLRWEDKIVKDPLSAVLRAMGYHRGRGQGDVEEIKNHLSETANIFEEELGENLTSNLHRIVDMWLKERTTSRRAKTG